MAKFGLKVAASFAALSMSFVFARRAFCFRRSQASCRSTNDKSEGSVADSLSASRADSRSAVGLWTALARLETQPRECHDKRLQGACIAQRLLRDAPSIRLYTDIRRTRAWAT